MLVNIAAAFELIFTTGRVIGDVGQATYVGYRTVNDDARSSRPDHVLLTPELFQCVQRSEIKNPDVQNSDHCEISVFFRVKSFTASCRTCGLGSCS